MLQEQDAKQIVGEIAADRRTKVNDITRNLLRLVATELYGRDVHFVLELIQNAEDNEYREQERARYIRFHLDADRIIVQNNECGFQRKNLEALCSAGQSTKRARTLGYVGEKGIGFKSVFKVTANPLVFSGGFQVRLDDHDFIVPEWTSRPEGIDVSKGTTIVLPLKPEYCGVDGLLARQVAQIDPLTLLFLRKLTRIEVVGIEGQAQKVIKRDGAESGVVKVTDGPTVHRWWLHRRELEVPPTVLEEKRKGVAKRELIIGIRVDADGSCREAVDARLYAFLPTEVRTGFPFLVQGDFLLTANREELLADSAWNQWLRRELPSTLVEAITKGCEEPKFAKSILACVPLPSQARHKFFAPAVDAVLEQLRKRPVFITESSTLRPASQVVYASRTIRRLFPNSELGALLGRPVEYLHNDCVVPRETLEALGVAAADGEHLLTMLGNEVWLKRQSDEWFVELYRFLHEHEHLVSLESLRRLKIVRLANGDLAAPVDGTIYLPAREERVEESYGLERFNWRIVRHELVRRDPSPKSEDAKTRNEHTQQAREFLIQRMGVRYHRPLEIASNEIIPYFERATAAGLSTSALKSDFGLVLYLKEQWADIEEAANQPDSGMELTKLSARLAAALPIPVIDCNGAVEVSPIGVTYLPATFGGSPEMEAMLRGVPGVVFVKDSFVEWDQARKQQDRKRQEWREFLLQMGANATLRLVPVEEETDGASAPEEAPAELRSARFVRIVKGVDAPDLISLLATIRGEPSATGRARAGRLLEHLDRNWSSLREKCGAAPGFTCEWHYRPRGPGRYAERSASLPAQFIALLRRVAWVPVEHGGFMKPSQVWLDVQNSAGRRPSEGVLSVRIKNPELIEALGFRTEASLTEIVQALRELVTEDRRDLGAFRRLFTQLAQLLSNRQVPLDELRRLAFQRLVYVPDRHIPYASPEEIVWETPTTQWSRGFPAISSHYPGLKDLFIAIGVRERATAQQVLDTLDRAARGGQPDETGLEQIRECYQVLVTLADDPETAHEVADAISSWVGGGVLFCRYHRFRPASQVFLPDDRRVAELFAQKIEVLWLPERTPADFSRRLGQLLGLARTSDASRKLSTKAAGHVPDELAQLEDCRRGMIGYIRQDHHARFQELWTDGRLAVLAAGPFVPVAGMTVEYELASIRVEDTKNMHAVIDDGRIHILASPRPSLDDVAEGLQRAFGSVPALAEVMTVLMPKKPRDREAYLRRREYGIPDEEWARIVTSYEGSELKMEQPPLSVKQPDVQPEDVTPGSISISVDGDELGALEETERQPPLPKGRPFVGRLRQSVPKGSNEDLRRRLGSAFPERDVTRYIEDTAVPDDPTFEAAVPDDEGVVHRVRTVLRAINIDEGFLRFHPSAMALFDRAKRPEEIMLVADDEQVMAVACVDYDRAIIHAGSDAERRSDFRALLETDAVPAGALLELEATQEPSTFHLHPIRLEESQVLTDVCWYDFDDHGRPETSTAQRVELEYKVHEPTYRAERRFEQRQAYEAIIKNHAVGVLQDIYETLSEDGHPGLLATEIHRRLMAHDHPCAFATVLGVLYGYRCFGQSGEGLWTLTSATDRTLKTGYVQAPAAPTPPVTDVEEKQVGDRERRSGESAVQRATPPQPNRSSAPRPTSEPIGRQDEESDEIRQIASISTSLRTGDLSEKMAALRRLVTLATKLLASLEAGLSASAPVVEQSPAQPETVSIALHMDAITATTHARNFARQAKRAQRTDRNLSLGLAMLAWDRAVASANRSVQAEAGAALGSALREVDASALAVQFFDRALRLGGACEAFDVALARQNSKKQSPAQAATRVQALRESVHHALSRRPEPEHLPYLARENWDRIVVRVINGPESVSAAS